ncbi:MAG: hypothetical protein MJZ26_03910 [Fibrobacter sp.]|nr:hypothetical protein [Fibrobacter sp.]
MKNLIATLFAVVVLSATFAFSEPAVATAEKSTPAENAAPAAEVASSAETPVAGSSEAAPAASVEAELKQEIAVRDSVMELQANSCSVEKDSLKKSLEVEQAKSANWEQSYNTLKQNNAACAQALSVSIGVNEKKKEKESMDRQQAAMMSSTAFMGGLGLGMLLFWLIFD